MTAKHRRSSRPAVPAWKRWIRLGIHDQVTTLEALGVLACVRTLVSTLPSAVVSSHVSRFMAAGVREHDMGYDVVARQNEILRVCLGIQRAAVRTPGATCLVQAIAGWLMLRRRGVGSSVKIGVQKNDHAFAVHAWLCVDGAVCIGGTDSSGSFQTLEPPSN